MGNPDSLVSRLRRSGLALVVLAAATCGDPAGPGEDPVPRLDRVVIESPTAVYADRTIQLQARVFNDRNEQVPSPLAWSVSDPAVATVSATGELTGHSAGPVVVSARAADVTGSLALTVQWIPVAELRVTPRVDSLLVGDTMQLTVVPLDAAGMPTRLRPVIWASSDTSRATVTADGRVAARAPGSFAITAVLDTTEGGAFLIAKEPAVVLEMPDSFTVRRWHQVQFLPSIRTGGGSPIAGSRVDWTSADSTVARVTPEGVVTPAGLGHTVIRATAGELQDSTHLTVCSEPVAHIWLLGGVAAWYHGDVPTSGPSARLLDSALRTVQDAVPTWESADTSALAVSVMPGDSLRTIVTGRRPGVTWLRARYQTMVDSLPVTVVFQTIVRFAADPDSLLLHVGLTRSLRVVGENRFGEPLFVGGYSLRSRDTSVARIAGGVAGVAPGRTLVDVLDSAGAVSDSVIIVVQSSPNSLLRFDGLAGSTPAFRPLATVLRSLDASGQPLGSGERVQIVSSDSSVVRVVNADIPVMPAAQTVVLQGLRPGSATITASDATGAFEHLSLVITSGRGMSLRIQPRPRTVPAGDSIALTTVAVDGTGMQSVWPLAWGVSDTTVATVSPAGVVLGRQAGEVTVTVDGLGHRDTISLRVLSTDAPLIDSIRPTVVRAGDLVTVHGAGFDPDPGSNTVTLGGRPASVMAASDAGVTFIAPAGACGARRREDLLVTSGGRTALDSLTTWTSDTLRIAAGALRELAPHACSEVLGPEGQVLVSITNIAPRADLTASGRLQHTVDVAPVPAPADVPPVAAATGIIPLRMDSLRGAVTAHARRLEEGQRLFRQVGAPGPLLAAARQRTGPQRAVTATVNGVARIRIPRVDRPDFCIAHTSVEARLVYDGQRVQVFEDVRAPVAGRMDTVIRAIGVEFDTLTLPLLRTTFGDPLAMDDQLDRNGKLAIVLSPDVNATGASGFVVSCDFYPESVAPSSNTGEIIYVVAPLELGAAYDRPSVAAWRWIIRSVLAHEGKHLVAYAERLLRGLALEETWLEEASAVVAEEIRSRAFNGTEWRRNSTYLQTLWCEVRPTHPACRERPYSMFNAFALMYAYLLEPERRTPLGPTTPDDASYYGSGWNFLRWTLDHFATTEADALRAIVTSPLTGVANLAQLGPGAGADGLGPWSMSLYADDVIPNVATRLRLPSWHQALIREGMAADFPNAFHPAPLQPGGLSTTGGDVAITDLPGGSTAHYLLPQVMNLSAVLHLLAPAGSPLRLSLMRAN